MTPRYVRQTALVLFSALVFILPHQLFGESRKTKNLKIFTSPTESETNNSNTPIEVQKVLDSIKGKRPFPLEAKKSESDSSAPPPAKLDPTTTPDNGVAKKNEAKAKQSVEKALSAWKAGKGELKDALKALDQYRSELKKIRDAKGDDNVVEKGLQVYKEKAKEIYSTVVRNAAALELLLKRSVKNDKGCSIVSALRASLQKDLQAIRDAKLPFELKDGTNLNKGVTLIQKAFKAEMAWLNSILKKRVDSLNKLVQEGNTKKIQNGIEEVKKRIALINKYASKEKGSSANKGNDFSSLSDAITKAKQAIRKAETKIAPPVVYSPNNRHSQPSYYPPDAPQSLPGSPAPRSNSQNEKPSKPSGDYRSLFPTPAKDDVPAKSPSTPPQPYSTGGNIGIAPNNQ
jgi:plasmid maintenance system killer protein